MTKTQFDRPVLQGTNLVLYDLTKSLAVADALENDGVAPVDITASPCKAPWFSFWAGAFLVSGPVFIEAPLVRIYPELAVVLAPVGFLIGWILLKGQRWHQWGDLLLGFTWSWLAGAIYWGWFLREPLWHLPIEAIGMPFVLFCLQKQWGVLGGLFYLGSFLGTAITDAYFYIVDLIPFWRQAADANFEAIAPILERALHRVETPWGVFWAIALGGLLLAIGSAGLRSRHPGWRAFSGAVLSTIVVDGLFWAAAVAGRL